MPEIMASLTSGKLDGAMLLSVYAFRGKEMGYRELWISALSMSLFHKVSR